MAVDAMKLYEVERLLDKRITSDLCTEYRVRWKGFSSEWDTWEPVSNLWDCTKVIQEFEYNLRSRTHEHAKKLIKKSKMRKERVVLKMKGKHPGKSKQCKISTAQRQNIRRGSSLSSKNKNQATKKKYTVKEKQSPGKKKKYGKHSPILNTFSKLETWDEPQKTKKPGEMKSPKSKGVKNMVLVSKVKTANYSPAKSKKNLPVKDVDGGQVVHVNGEVSFLIRKDASKHITPSKKKKVVKVQGVNGTKNKESFIKTSNSPSKFDSLEKKSLPKKRSVSIKKNAREKKDLISSTKNTPKKLKHTSKTMNVKDTGSPIFGGKVLKISVEKFSGVPDIGLSPDVNLTSEKKVGKVTLTPNAKDRKSQGNDEIKSKKRKRKVQDEVFNVTESDTDDDDDVLYSLVEADATKDVSKYIPELKADFERIAAKKDSVNVKSFTVKKVKKIASTSIQSQEEPSGTSKAKRMRLIDSMKNHKYSSELSLQESLHSVTSRQTRWHKNMYRKRTSSTVRPISPTPLFTTVKPIMTNYFKPSSSVTSASLDKYDHDELSHYQYIPATVIPVSPSSMTYQVILDNLQTQLQPKKGVKRKEIDTSAITSAAAGDVERRLSVRQSECAFRYKEIVVKKCQKYTQIWLNTHTTMKNALNPQVIQEAMAALNSAKYDDSSLVMFSGLGNVFCSGIDLHFLVSGDRRMAARQMVDALREFTKTLIMFSKPIVAVVTGPAIGLGMTMLPLCDVVYASDKATFYLPYAQLGQTPEGCATYTLPQAMGMAMANELLIGSRKITAIEACQLGLVSQVFWPTSMMQEVIPRIQNMAVLSSKALETTKLLIRSHQRTKLDLTNESESNLLLERWLSPECQKSIEEYIANEKNYSF